MESTSSMPFIALFLSVFAIGLFVACTPPQDRTSPAPTAPTAQSEPLDLIGKTIEYRYGESIYHVHIDTDSEMHWEAVAGEEKGVKEDETYKLQYLDDQTIFITWGEANGIGVSQVLDFRKGIVYNHLLRGRDVSVGTGEIRILN